MVTNFVPYDYYSQVQEIFGPQYVLYTLNEFYLNQPFYSISILFS